MAVLPTQTEQIAYLQKRIVEDSRLMGNILEERRWNIAQAIFVALTTRENIIWELEAKAAMDAADIFVTAMQAEAARLKEENNK